MREIPTQPAAIVKTTDYVSMEDAIYNIREILDAMKDRKRRNLEGGRKIGVWLNKLKSFRPNQWLAVYDELEMSRSTGALYMRIAEHWSEIEEHEKKQGYQFLSFKEVREYLTGFQENNSTLRDLACATVAQGLPPEGEIKEDSSLSSFTNSDEKQENEPQEITGKIRTKRKPPQKTRDEIWLQGIIGQVEKILTRANKSDPSYLWLQDLKSDLQKKLQT